MLLPLFSFLLVATQLIGFSFAIVTHARALLFNSVDKPQDTGLQTYAGTIDFYQDSNGHVTVNGSITGLTAGDHGFHIHVFGAYGGKCVDAGAHFNPDKKEHGSPNDTERHVGDLGNIHADSSGNALINIQDSLVSLNGRNSAVGRAVVVHLKPDDLGKGQGELRNDSKKTGNAGPRFACGIIGVVEENDANAAVSIRLLPLLQQLAALFVLLSTFGSVFLLV